MLAKLRKLRDEGFVERQAGDMSGSVDTEAVDAELDEVAVAFHEIVRDSGVLGIQIHAVTGNLCPPAVRLVPVELSIVVPVVLGVVVLIVGVLHHRQATLILVCGLETVVVGTEDGGDRCQTPRGALGGELLTALELRAEMSLSEVAGVVEDNVEDDLDTFLVSGIDEFLKHHVTGALAIATLIAAVDLREVGGMVAVIVIPRGILHDRVDPDSGEAKGFDIVEPVDESLEVTTPAWVFGRNLAFLIVPAQHVVAGIAIVETSGEDEVDTLVAEVCSAANKAVCHHALTEEQSGECQCRDPSCKVFHVWFL